MLYPMASEAHKKAEDRFHRTLVNIESIEADTVHVVLPSMDEDHVIILNRDVIPIMFYGVLIQQDDPYLLATANIGIDVKDIHKLVIKDWELPDFSVFEYGFVDNSKLDSAQKLFIHTMLKNDNNLYTDPRSKR